MRLSEQEKIELENVVDHHGLTAVLRSLAEIAFEKGEHLRSNWGDGHSAKCWDRVGKAIDKTAEVSADYLGDPSV